MWVSIKFAPTVTLTVTREGGQLYAMLTGEPKFEIFPEGEKYFEGGGCAANVRRGLGGTASEWAGSEGEEEEELIGKQPLQ